MARERSGSIVGHADPRGEGNLSGEEIEMARLPMFVAAGILFVMVAVAAILLVSRNDGAARLGRERRSQDAQIDAQDLAADRSVQAPTCAPHS